MKTLFFIAVLSTIMLSCVQSDSTTNARIEQLEAQVKSLSEIVVDLSQGQLDLTGVISDHQDITADIISQINTLCKVDQNLIETDQIILTHISR